MTTLIGFRGMATLAKRVLSVQALLEWAFAVEKAQIEKDPRRQAAALAGIGMPGVGMEYILAERMRLGGVRIDTSIGRSYPHEDAEVVAAMVENLPEYVGGFGMAVRVAEFARIRSTPDWMPGEKPKCVAVRIRQTTRGERGIEEVVDVLTYAHRGRRVRFEVKACPVTYRPSGEQIAAARRGYSQWWSALLHLNGALSSIGLRVHELSGALPPAAPWTRKGVDKTD